MRHERLCCDCERISVHIEAVENAIFDCPFTKCPSAKIARTRKSQTARIDPKGTEGVAVTRGTSVTDIRSSAYEAYVSGLTFCHSLRRALRRAIRRGRRRLHFFNSVLCIIFSIDGQTDMAKKATKNLDTKLAQEFSDAFSVEAAQEVFARAHSERLAATRTLLLRFCHAGGASESSVSGSLESLTDSPHTFTRAVPQVLLFEGGTEEERQALALWWSAVQHCSNIHQHGSPCGQCTACLHIATRMHTEVFAFDGRISNAEDEKNPGPVRALNKDNTEELKLRLGDSTRDEGKRVVIMSGIEGKRSAAANALLKVLEEPSLTTIFILLAPQREQLLPTLVSRSWVITLPWPCARTLSQDFLPWEYAIANFLSGKRATEKQPDWWALNGTKNTADGPVDAKKALYVLLLCQKCLLMALSPSSTLLSESASSTHLDADKNYEHAHTSPLATYFMHLSPEKLLHISALVDKTQEMVLYGVHAGRCLDSFIMSLFLVCRQGATRP